MTINRPLRLLGLTLVLCAIGFLAGAEGSSATVLCKTATDPCTGGTYDEGTTIEAKTSGHSVLDSLSGKVECASSIKGEVTGAGGEGLSVTGTISTFSFTGCTTAEVQVLKKGTFAIGATTTSGNGKLTLEGFETTVVTYGLHCIFSGPVSIPLKGGSMASIGTTGATVPRTGGTSGAFCGSSAPWTVDYTVTAPEPLYVAET